MSDSSYEQCIADWNALKQKIKSNFTAEKNHAESEIQKKEAQQKAALSKLKSEMAKLNSDKLSSEDNDAESKKIDDKIRRKNQQITSQENLQGRQNTQFENLRNNYNQLETDIDKLIKEIEDIFTLSYSPGRNTSTIMRAHSTRWSSITERVTNLQTQMESKGLDPAWRAFSSSDAYKAAVNPQLEALKELNTVATASQKGANSIATIQDAIYTATVSSIGVTSSSLPTAVESGTTNLFSSSRTALPALKTLKEFVERNRKSFSESDWSSAASQVSKDLAEKKNSVNVLTAAGNWPQAVGEDPKVKEQKAEVQAAETQEVNPDITEAGSTGKRSGWSV